MNSLLLSFTLNKLSLKQNSKGEEFSSPFFIYLSIMRYHHSLLIVLLVAILVFAQNRGPLITPEGGLFSSDRLVMLSNGINDSNAVIYYTLDGSNPLLSKSRILYKSPFRISKTLEVIAISISSKGLKSELSSAKFKKITKLKAPSIQQLTNSNSYAIFSEQKLKEEGIELYYTIDGRDPSVFGHRYKGEIFSKHGIEIKAVALHREREYLNSDVVSHLIDTSNHKKSGKSIVQEIFFKKNKNDSKDTSSLKIHWKNGENAGDFLVSFSHDNTNISYIYTLDGTDPIPGSTMWNGKPFSVKSPAHIKVRTFEIGMKLGDIKEKIFNPAQLPEPVSDVPSGTPFSGTLSIRLSVPGEDINKTEILYTINGKDPLLEGKLYNSPIVLNESSVIRTIAQGAGFSTSKESRFEYFHMIEITSAIYIDKNKDGYVETVRLTLSSVATEKPPQMKFIDPSNGREVIVRKENIVFGESGDLLIVSFSKQLRCSSDFAPGHFGSVSVAGEYSTTPFLVYGENSKQVLESEKSLSISITNNPFIPGHSTLPENIQEVADFAVMTGTAISVRPKKPSFGYVTIFDALGNVMLSKREMVEDETGVLYLLWDGMGNSGNVVNCGNYLVIILTEEKVSGISAQGRAFVSVKCQ